MRSTKYDEEENQEKQEEDHNHQVLNLNNNNNNMLQQQNQTQASSRQWSTSAFRNPRIVRVSRTFGGKDRHSKVCTVRGLRDRRIRLSVPTAIQLYDLQDRLGLSQPSKVVDWLLEAAKDDVDKLPPLQFPLGFNQMYPNNLIFGDTSSTTSTMPFQGTSNTNLGFLESWDLGGSSSSRTRSRNIQDQVLDKGKWIKQDDQDQEFNNNTSRNISAYSHELATEQQQQHNVSMTNPYNNNTSYYNLGHLQHSLNQSGNNVTVAISSNVDANNNNNNLNLLTPPCGDGSQLFFRPPPPAMSSLFPTYPSFLGASHHNHNNLQLFGSDANTVSSQQEMIRPFHHHLMSSNRVMDRHSSDNDSDS
ncbi:unnamed protein product [Cochlearia groenlandica]